MRMKTMMPTVAFMMASIFSLQACATTTVQPLALGELSVKILPDTNVEIVQTFARQDGENVVINGHMQRKKVHGRLIPTGHVDIAIIDKDGKTIHQTFTRVSPEILPSIDGVKSSFKAQIPVKAQQGSLVKVKFHSGPHEG